MLLWREETKNKKNTKRIALEGAMLFVFHGM